MRCPARPIRPRLLLAAVISTLTLLGGATANAQDTDATDAPDRYRVEVVLFTQPPVDDGRLERPLPEAVPLPERMAWPLRRTNAGMLGYQALPSASHVLARAAARLDARGGFDVLWHAAWEQPGLGPAQAPAVALPGRLRAEGVTGFVRVYRQRFLHVEAELRYAESGERHWAMSASRRMRSDQQHYLDHPRLGLLVRVDDITGEPR